MVDKAAILYIVDLVFPNDCWEIEWVAARLGNSYMERILYIPLNKAAVGGFVAS